MIPLIVHLNVSHVLFVNHCCERTLYCCYYSTYIKRTFSHVLILLWENIPPANPIENALPSQTTQFKGRDYYLLHLLHLSLP